MSNKGFLGFTLIELLVIIAIIGIVAAPIVKHIQVGGLQQGETFNIPIGAQCKIGDKDVTVVDLGSYQNQYKVLIGNEVEEVDARSLNCNKAGY